MGVSAILNVRVRPGSGAR